MHHPAGEHQSGEEIKVGLHEEDCPQFVNLDYPGGLLEHARQAGFPLGERAFPSDGQLGEKGVDFTQCVVGSCCFIMAEVKAVPSVYAKIVGSRYG